MKNPKGRDRDRDSRGGSNQRGQMFEAVCAECGQTCEVPFRPTGDKPVYCTNCFSKRQANQPRREGGDFRHRDRDRGDRRMFSAICDKCGKACQVPFQPTPGKPVYCEQCFGKDRGGAQGGGAGKNEQQLVSINAKLDKIINALVVAKLIKANVEVKKEVKVEPKKVEPVKEAKKKAPAKKAAAKKVAKKKK